ncbi:hypothetical protein EMIHUDRAFT_195822 [Emiliania huxleyi CCMP1516]|uniref:Uncharacterized protein n=2 Tax=Emiliania huxleyi TaxID=2903 RepID=A0A0D3JI49_EMIH1|nr:hypothetical protein EMIHUDRAFT_195822 [Emiliania huxleyi CCMP1516]EOD23184.1 hypothetical protein EMIHUDRAFT_195822 [Emiliania huxleyi CCMP1516]|eukprot:XP_005775613.1 hypothetical protein EMIHUDRAFT_195822 [Emiliania huxleyi CCMP1516]
MLRYVDLGWGDAEAAQLAEVLASGAAPRLVKLTLGVDNEKQPELVAVCKERGISLY